MNPQLARRQFLTAMTGSIALGSTGWSRPSHESSAPLTGRPDEIYSVSLAQWSLHRMLRAGELDNLNFAAFTKETFGIEAVEYVNAFFFQRATDFAYLKQMKTRADDAGVKSLLIMCDGEGELADADNGKRRKSIWNHYKWVVAAAYLGCHSIRVNAAGAGTYEDTQSRAAESLVELAEYADQYGISVIVENHGGLSSNGAWLSGVMRKADHDGVGTLPDFGNFRIQGDEWYDRYQGVEELMPFAKAVSAKSHEFDSSGLETNTDYTRMIDIVLKAGYSGYIGVEYEGGKHSEVDGVKLTRDLLLKVRAERAEK
ncbi:MAG: L-ribulose-5-phosphate 3-epimerase [Planctomycetota bacterium]|jgi:L-ribulose-5-phosphate 3-epimerase